MENIHESYDSVTGADENWSEDVEYTQDDSHNDDSVQAPSYPESQEDTASSLEEEDVVETKNEGEQAIPNFDLNYSTKYQTATSPDNDDFVDTQPIHQSATSLGAGPSADAPQHSSNRSFLSDEHWAQNDNDYGPIQGEAGTSIGENECGNSNRYYMGMDNQWYPCVSPQNLQTGRSSYSAGADQYRTHHKLSAYPLSYTTASLHSSHQLGVGEGSPLEYLHPANVQLPQQIGSRSSHAKSPSRPSRLVTKVTTPNQQASPTSQSDSGSYSHRPFTDEDFLPKIRKGGKLMEDRVTWNMEAQKNHYDCWARYHGRPALPKAVQGGLSDFKLRSNAIEALNEADQQSLQDFINAAKYFAITGNPNRPSNRQAAIDLGSGCEEESEMESVNRPGTYQVIAAKKRSREETKESDDTPGIRRKRTKLKSTVRQGNSHPESQPFTKNPQGQMYFSDMEAANQWLASLGQPSILEAANTYLANRGIPSIIIENPRSMDLSYLGYPYVNIGSQRDSVAPFPAGVNRHSAGVPGPGHRGSSRLSVPHKRKADTDSEDQGDAAHMTGSRVKKPRTGCTGLINMLQGSKQAAPQRQQIRLKRRRGPLQQHAIPTVHTKAQRQNTEVAESSSPRCAGAETASPDVYGRGASVASNHRSTISSNGADVKNPYQYAHIASSQSRYADLIQNQNLSQTFDPPSGHGRHSSMENCQKRQSANEGLAGEGHGNYQAFDSNVLGVEHGEHGHLDLGPASVEQDNLADFDFGCSSLGDSDSSRNMMPTPRNNENETENNVSIPQNNDDYDWLNEYFDFETLPEDRFRQKHQ